MKRFTLAFSALSALCFASLSPAAQTASPVAGVVAIAAPMLPLLTNYSYWPVQFVQWVGAELPYSMIELDTDGNAKHPMLYVTLTDRATGKRIHYSDNDGLLAAAKALGEEAHKTALAYEPADTETVGSISTLRFTMADEKPLQWRFVQGSEISEQGSGLSPLPTSKIPIFAYREQAAVAGEGTALQIGATVSTASVWTEISQPPYFVAYRGAESDSAHTLVFLPGQESWTTTASPATLAVGSTWELDEAHGNHRSIRIDKVDGPHLTVTATDRFTPSVHCILEVTRAGDGWSVERARFAPVRDGEKHFLALQFANPLLAAADSTSLTLLAGKKSIAQGKLAGSGEGASRSTTLSFTNPGWLDGKTLTESATIGATTVALVAHP